MNNSCFGHIAFEPVALAHKKIIDPIFKKFPPHLANYTFSTLISWKNRYAHAWNLQHDDLLLLSTHLSGRKHLLQPIGNFSKEDEAFLLEAIDQMDYPVKIYAVSDPFLLRHQAFCAHFEVTLDRSMANYLYLTSDLIHLAGGHYEKKRNLIAQAKHLYRWKSHSMTKECRPHCFKILSDIGPHPSTFEENELQSELNALEYTLEHFDELGLSGISISIDGKPAAFSIYEALNPQCSVVHFEKAERHYKGLYQIINQETAKAIGNDGFKYINREEDLGIPGLRRAKTSYFPIAILSSYTLTYTKN